ncbi:MAG: sigma-70 family RNA polymerase sigma factor [Thermoguttaceae bacterium]|nr:sigma-70 family RNA polymerase sigma factor [Thermoguttaceae bacterium]MDW8079347.1 sigma-70 family RNA polymerase sigma factor [Thermoguttaceae bacterium]
MSFTHRFEWLAGPKRRVAEQDQQELAWQEVERLASAAKEGNRAAWEGLVARFYNFVYNQIYRLVRDHNVAEDLTQETFLRAFERIGQLRSGRVFAAWLSTLTRRIVSYYRRAQRRWAFEQPHADGFRSATCQLSADTPMKYLEEREIAELIRRLVAAMHWVDRQTIEQFYFSGRTLGEMSQQFGCPVGTLKRRLHTARCRLGKQLRQLGLV